MTPAESTVQLPSAAEPIEILDAVGHRITSQSAPKIPVLDGTLTEILRESANPTWGGMTNTPPS